MYLPYLIDHGLRRQGIRPIHRDPEIARQTTAVLLGSNCPATAPPFWGQFVARFGPAGGCSVDIGFILKLLPATPLQNAVRLINSTV